MIPLVSLVPYLTNFAMTLPRPLFFFTRVLKLPSASLLALYHDAANHLLRRLYSLLEVTLKCCSRCCSPNPAWSRIKSTSSLLLPIPEDIFILNQISGASLRLQHRTGAA